MVLAAYRYFSSQGGGHISVISSIAGTKGLGVAPSYSATKRYQNIYIDALAHFPVWRNSLLHLRISVRDLSYGFIERRQELSYADVSPIRRLAYPNAIDRKKRRAIIDWRYAILVFLWRLIPEWLWERLPIRN